MLLDNGEPSNYEEAMAGQIPSNGWTIEAKVSRCFDEMVAIVSVGVDLDDSTTIVRDVAP